MSAIARNKRMDSIPTYRANGKRLSDSSLERVERLLALKLVVARRDRHGRIRNIQFKWENGHLEPLRKTAHMGQHYSFPLWIEGHRTGTWDHKPLVRDERSLEALFGEKPDNREEAERFVQAIFRAVPLSCLKEERSSSASARREPKRLAPVVNIADYRKTTQMSGEEKLAA
jgi:hypothetical protein